MSKTKKCIYCGKKTSHTRYGSPCCENCNDRLVEEDNARDILFDIGVPFDGDDFVGIDGGDF
jgi:hypothetical protein